MVPTAAHRDGLLTLVVVNIKTNSNGNNVSICIVAAVGNTIPEHMIYRWLQSSDKLRTLSQNNSALVI